MSALSRETSVATAGEAGGSAADRPPDFGPDLAKSVTRQVQISGPCEWKHLLTGVDSLDLGLYVEWPKSWPELEKALADQKDAAAGTKGIRWEGAPNDSCLILPGGKPPMYAFHLQLPECHLFLARRQRATKYPNVYVSFLAQSLWLEGVRPSVDRISDFVAGLGGVIERIQVSRCDMCCDFHLPGGLGLDWLRETKVARARAWRPFLNGNELETFYVGGSGGDLQCRIYNKAVEIARDGLKSWFLKLWKIEELSDVWRVEFQLRREVLKQYGVDSLPDLIVRSGGIWESLTSAWLSLRHADNPNPTRRTVHAWWQAVQDASREFGSQIAAVRNYEKTKCAPVDWYVSHAAGCLVGYGARLGVPNLSEVLQRFVEQAEEYWAIKDFGERYRVERIALGFNDTQGADS